MNNINPWKFIIVLFSIQITSTISSTLAINQIIHCSIDKCYNMGKKADVCHTLLEDCPRCIEPIDIGYNCYPLKNGKCPINKMTVICVQFHDLNDIYPPSPLLSPSSLLSSPSPSRPQSTTTKMPGETPPPTTTTPPPTNKIPIVVSSHSNSSSDSYSSSSSNSVDIEDIEDHEDNLIMEKPTIQDDMLVGDTHMPTNSDKKTMVDRIYFIILVTFGVVLGVCIVLRHFIRRSHRKVEEIANTAPIMELPSSSTDERGSFESNPQAMNGVNQSRVSLQSMASSIATIQNLEFEHIYRHEQSQINKRLPNKIHEELEDSLFQPLKHRKQLQKFGLPTAKGNSIISSRVEEDPSFLTIAEDLNRLPDYHHRKIRSISTIACGNLSVVSQKSDEIDIESRYKIPKVGRTSSDIREDKKVYKI